MSQVPLGLFSLVRLHVFWNRCSAMIFLMAYALCYIPHSACMLYCVQCGHSPCMTRPQDHLTCVETVTFVVVNTPHNQVTPESPRYSGSTRAAHAFQAVMGPERTPAVSAFPFPSVITTMGFPRINLNKPDDWVAAVKAHAFQAICVRSGF